MDGKIYHEWNGTVLTITSDSGTSSADLKGDTGARGAQGKCGVVVDEEGNVLVNVATEEYVQEQITKVNTGGSVDLSLYATKEYVDDRVANSGGGNGGNVDLSNYYTKAETDQKIANVDVDLTGYATEVFVQQKIAEAQLDGDGTVDLGAYYTKTETDQKIEEAKLSGGTTDLSNYYTKAETDTAIKNAVDAIEPAEPDLSAYAKKTDLNSYAKKTDVPTVPSNVSAFTNDANYVDKTYVDNAIKGVEADVDLSDYYTKTEVGNTFVSKTAFNQSVSEMNSTFLDESEVLKLIEENNGSASVDLTDYYTKSEVQSNYYTKTQIEAKGYQNEAQVNMLIDNYASSGGFDVDLSSYYTKTEIEELNYQNEEQVQAIVNQNALPTVSYADDGKILTVVDGRWAAKAMTILEEVSF